MACNQTTDNKEEKSIENKQIDTVLNKSVSLSVEPNIFKLSELPEVLTVKLTNNSNDTITTGLHYQIENYENNEWKEILPKDIAFNDIGWRLKPTDSEIFEKKLYKNQIHYKAGKYRIIKYYLKSDYQEKRENFNVYGEFEIK